MNHDGRILNPLWRTDIESAPTDGVFESVWRADIESVVAGGY